MTQRSITVILILIVVGGLAWYINKTYIAQEGARPLDDNLQTTTAPGEIAETLVYVSAGNVRDIWAWTDKPRKIFTDADETEKILKLSNVLSDTGEVLAIVNQNTSASSGKLIKINLRNGQKQTLQSDFPKPFYWAISDDGTKICYVLFSNVEENYGYTLYSSKVDGGQPQKMFNSASEIKSPTWDNFGLNVAFISSEGTKVLLQVVDEKTAKVSPVKNFDNQTADWLVWQGDDLLFSRRDIGANNGEVDFIQTDGQNLEKIFDFQGGVASYLWPTQGENYIAFLIAQYKERIDDQTNGQIYNYNKNEDEKKALIKGSQILGWVKE